MPPVRVTADVATGCVELRPARESMIGQRYPETTFYIVTPDTDALEAIGGDGLLYADGESRGGLARRRQDETGHRVLAGHDRERPRRWPGAGTCRRPPSDASAAADRTGRRGRRRRRLVDRACVTARPSRGRDRPDRRGPPTARRPAALVSGRCHGPLHDPARARAVQRRRLGRARRDPGTRRVPRRHAATPSRSATSSRVVYEHQDRQTGDWPQWFMFDRYREIRAPDSHADIIHWPIKALCDYAETTGDLSILDDEVAYTDPVTKAPTADKETIFAHTERQIDAIERGCIPGTSLVVFAGGDWEDTLQPVDATMAERLVSSWTVELAYQTLSRYRRRLRAGGEGSDGSPADGPRRPHACRLQPLPDARWRRRWSGVFPTRRSRLLPSSARPGDRRPLPAHPDDARHHRGDVHARSGDAATPRSSTDT